MSVNLVDSWITNDAPFPIRLLLNGEERGVLAVNYVMPFQQLEFNQIEVAGPDGFVTLHQNPEGSVDVPADSRTRITHGPGIASVFRYGAQTVLFTQN